MLRWHWGTFTLRLIWEMNPGFLQVCSLREVGLGLSQVFMITHHFLKPLFFKKKKKLEQLKAKDEKTSPPPSVHSGKSH